MSHSRWNLLPPIPDNHPLNKSGYPRLLTQLLYNRGLTEASQLDLFLTADDSLIGDPFLLPGMHKAVPRIYQALLSGEKIAVYGDFDTDGITATALLVQGLSFLNCQATPYIPHRLTEGYGLKTAALKKLRQQGIDLVITVDCGITGLQEVKKANRMGLDVIITDHHTPPPEIPPATATINPRLPDSNYPFPDLAGVGVALKLLQALFQGVGKEENLKQLIDLAAIGTVADMMPLTGENRYLVKQGLQLISRSPRLGIREIITRSGLNIENISSENISWTLAPRLNAAGRLEHAMSSYKLLMTDSPDEAQELAGWLEGKNTERQNLTRKAFSKAKEQILDKGISPVLIATDNDFPVGICGLVAGRLAEEFYRPSVVIRTNDHISSGSCRSISEFNIINALSQCSKLFTHFGGHAQAAGFSLPTRNLPELEQTLLDLARTQLEGVDLRPKQDVDAEVKLTDLVGDTFATIQKMAPFGEGNPAPVFTSHNVEVINCRTMGNTGDHLRLTVKQDGAVWDSVGFGLGSYLSEIHTHIDIVYNLELDRWNGQERLRLNILDFQPVT